MELKPWTEVGIAAVHGLVEVCERVDEAPFLTSLTELEYRVGEPHFDPGTDAMVVVDGGDLLGWATVWHEPSGERLERCHLSGSVPPDHRGLGVGSRLLAWQVERGKAQLGAYDHDLPRFLRTFERAEQRDAHALLEDHGFAAVRWFEELLRPVEPLDAPEPTGIQIVPWDDSLSEAVRTVKNRAFGDHWGSTPTGEEAWVAWMADPMVRLDLSRIALDDGRVVGYSINAHYPEDEERTGRRDGWIDSLGVLAECRGRGIASTLIAHSVTAFADAEFTHALLGVDSDNPTGAAGLYRRLGFAPLHRSVTHELEVGSAGSR